MVSNTIYFYNEFLYVESNQAKNLLELEIVFYQTFTLIARNKQLIK